MIHKDFRESFYKCKKPEIPNDDIDLVKLFSNIVSGLLDVDRMDYLERDSRNAGIKYGLVESQRLTTALVPVLARKQNETFSGILCKARLVHAIDHFLVGLYEMYTTLYKHPGYEGFQHEAGAIIKKLNQEEFLASLDVKSHSQHTDLSFFALLNEKSNNLVEKLISRKLMKDRLVFQRYSIDAVEVSDQGDFILIGEITDQSLKIA